VKGIVVGNSRNNEGDPRDSRRRKYEIQMIRRNLSSKGRGNVGNGLRKPQIDFSPARTSTGQNSPM
jgi:hypothetical protein